MFITGKAARAGLFVITPDSKVRVSAIEIDALPDGRICAYNMIGLSLRPNSTDNITDTTNNRKNTQPVRSSTTSQLRILSCACIHLYIEHGHTNARCCWAVCVGVCLGVYAHRPYYGRRFVDGARTEDAHPFITISLGDGYVGPVDDGPAGERGCVCVSVC